MAFTSEQQELHLQVTGQLEVERLRKEIGTEELAVRQAAVAHGYGRLTLGQYEAQVVRSSSALVQHRGELAEVQKSTRNYASNIQGLGYALNDFGSAGGDFSQRLNGIANNLPAVFAGFGGLGLALSAIVPAIAAVIQNWDSITDLFVNKNPLPETAKTAEHLAEALKAATNEMDGLRKKTGLTNDELDRFNELEKEIEQQRNVLAAAKAKEQVEAAPSEARRDRVAEFKRAVDKLGGSQVVTDLRKIIEEANSIRGQLSIAPEAVESAVRASVAGLNRGDAKVLQGLKDLLEAGYGRSTKLAQGFVDGFVTAQEETAKRLKEGALEEAARKNSQAQEEAARKADGVKVDMLNHAGVENEHAFRREQAEEAEKARKQAEDEQAKRSKEQAVKLDKTVDGAVGDLGKGSTIGQDMRGGLDQLRSEGGYLDQKGRFVPVDPKDRDKQQMIQAEDADERLKRERPDLDTHQRRAVAVKLAQETRAQSEAGEMQDNFDQFRSEGGHYDQHGRFVAGTVPGQDQPQAEGQGRQPRGKAAHAGIASPFGFSVPGGVVEGGASAPQGGGFRSVPVSAPQPQGPSAADLAQATVGRDGAMLGAMGQQSNLIGSLVARLNASERAFQQLANATAGQNARFKNNRSIGR